MTTPTAHDTTTSRLRSALTALTTLGAVAALAACGGTTESAGNVAVPAPLPTIGITTPDTVPASMPATTPPPTTTPSVPPSTAPPAPPPPAPPPPPPAPTPTPPPTTTTPPPTTTAPPTFFVDDADFFKGRHAESGGGINSQNFWFTDPDTRRARAKTAHGPFAIAEAADVKAMLYTSFQPRSPEATVTWDVSWKGFATSFVGADSEARARVTVRVYEIIPTTGGPATVGPVVFSETVLDDGVGAALQGVATLRMEGRDNRTVVLPPLDMDKFYRLEAELRCTSRVAFSIGATVCAFAEDDTYGLRVNDWSIRYDNVLPR